MRLKKMKDKFFFIDALCEDDDESILKKMQILQKLSCDKNPEVRAALARQLVLFDVDAIEEILYGMLFDKNRWVRLEAVDSLSIGRQEKTIEKIKTMIENEGSFIRAYAVMTLFDLITNRYGVNNDAYNLYEICISGHFMQEKNTKVLLAYYQNRFYLNSEDGLCLLEQAYIEAVEKSDYKSVWTLLHIFQEIRNFQNQYVIRRIVNYNVGKLLQAQQELVNNITICAVQKKILIVDQDNTYLSHIVSAVLNDIKNFDLEIKTAGLDVGTVQEKKSEIFVIVMEWNKRSDMFQKG